MQLSQIFQQSHLTPFPQDIFLCRTHRCELKMHLCFPMRTTGQILKPISLIWLVLHHWSIHTSFVLKEDTCRAPDLYIQISTVTKLETLNLCILFLSFNKRSSKSHRGYKSCFRPAFLQRGTFLVHSYWDGAQEYFHCSFPFLQSCRTIFLCTGCPVRYSLHCIP